MSEWINHLANRIKEVDEGAAEKILAERHRNRIIGIKGPIFYSETISGIKRDVDKLVSRLAGSVTDFPTSVETIGAVCTITREACPAVWANLSLEIQNGLIHLQYRTNNPVQPSQAVQSQNRTFTFEIGDNESVFLSEPFGESAKKFHEPDQFAEHIIKLLFAV